MTYMTEYEDKYGNTYVELIQRKVELLKEVAGL